MMTTKPFAAMVLPLLLALGSACGGASGSDEEQVGLGADTQLTSREGTVVVDGCVLDTWQKATLASPRTRRVLGTVIMLCLVPREDGTVGPRDPSARAALSALAGELRGSGYRVHFGVAFTDESGQRYDGGQTRSFLADPAWRARFKSSLGPLLEPADGVEIDLQQLPNDAAPAVTALFGEISPTIRPAKRIGVFVPPSVANPSDLPGGDAIPRAPLAPFVDRMRIMTLDFSEAGPGPTIDPGWAVDAVRLAKTDFAGVDISYPLYGTDFGPRGRRPITYLEAHAIAALGKLRVEEGPTGARFVRYVNATGEPHELWFDDATSTGRALGAWTPDVLPTDVGILYYGLGAEDPLLFERIAARLP